MGLIAFDIETVVSDEGRKIIESANVSAPSNYKDQVKIDAYVEEKRKELLEKAALYWWTGKIVCISLWDVDSNIPWAMVSDNESELLRSFFSYLSEFPNHRLIGKNSDEFDSPWIRGRAMRHDLGIPKHFRLPHAFGDVQKIFGYNRSASQVTSLKNMGEALQLNTRKSGDGSDVAELWRYGQHEELKAYCLDDTRMVAEIWRRYEKEFSV
jgi:DNA polymerase elongation subunit (family B)